MVIVILLGILQKSNKKQKLVEEQIEIVEELQIVPRNVTENPLAR